MNLKGKTIIITGASRGIGKAMALRFAQDGANIVAAAKSLKPHPKLPGTIAETARLVNEQGGNGLAIKVDVRFPEQVQAMVQETVDAFGGIDVLINNAGAISLTNVENTSIKLFDRMHAVNDRAVFLCAQAALPYLKKSDNPHILNLSPPLNFNPKWLKDYIPYTRSKYGMTLMTLGMAEEFREQGIAVNSLWPRTLIATAAIEFAVGDKKMLKQCRKPQIMADAAYSIITTKSTWQTGQCLIDEQVLRENGTEDFSIYSADPDNPQNLLPDIFLD